MIIVPRPNGFIHYVDVFQIRKFGSNSIEPFRDVSLGLLHGNAGIFLFAKEIRVLRTPDQRVKFKMPLAGLFFCPVVCAFALVVIVPGEPTRTTVAIRKRMDGTPFATVFRRNLIPKIAHVAANLAARCDISQKFRPALRKRCSHSHRIHGEAHK